MKELIQKMEEYCTYTIEESKRIHSILVDFVKKAGGTIDVSNEDNENDTIYAIVYNEFAEGYSDYSVDKVKVDAGDLMIHLPDYYSDDEEDLWFNVMGGMVLINATLFNLCECLHEYVE